MDNQAEKLKSIVEAKNAPNKTKRTHFIAITSGKGGVGKSTISANLANVLSNNGYKVGLLDADIGLANLDVILNVRIKQNLLNVLNGECSLKDVLIRIKDNLILIPGDSGDEILKFNNQFLFERFMQEAQELDDFDFIIIDTGAGIGENIQLFLESADEVIVVTVPDPAAITDAYAMIKVTSKTKKDLLMILNMVRDDKEALRIFESIKKIAVKNIGNNLNLELLGFLQHDKNVSKSIKQRTLFSDDMPYSSSSSEIKQIASKLLFRLERKVLKNDSNMTIGSFFKRLFEQF